MSWFGAAGKANLQHMNPLRTTVPDRRRIVGIPAFVLIAVCAILIPTATPAQELAGGVYHTGETMINLTPRTIITGALLVPTLALGYWLSATGKPYNQLVFTVHKLLPLGALVVLDYTAHQVNKIERLGAGDVAALVAMNLCFLATIVTGGLVSLETPMPSAVRWTHKIGPWAATASSALLLVTLGRG